MIRIMQSACFVSAVFAFALILSGCSPKESELRGQELFDLHCAVCHMGPTPDLKKRPPRLEKLFAVETASQWGTSYRYPGAQDNH